MVWRIGFGERGHRLRRCRRVLRVSWWCEGGVREVLWYGIEVVGVSGRLCGEAGMRVMPDFVPHRSHLLRLHFNL